MNRFETDSQLQAESQVVIEAQTGELTESKGKFSTKGTVFEIDDYSFDIKQTLNIGSQSKGAGAGRVTFNPFSITRKIDKASPVFYQMACSGTPFQEVCLGLRKASALLVSGPRDVHLAGGPGPRAAEPVAAPAGAGAVVHQPRPAAVDAGRTADHRLHHRGQRARQRNPLHRRPHPAAPLPRRG